MDDVRLPEKSRSMASDIPMLSTHEWIRAGGLPWVCLKCGTVSRKAHRRKDCAGKRMKPIRRG